MQEIDFCLYFVDTDFDSYLKVDWRRLVEGWHTLVETEFSWTPFFQKGEF